MSVITFPKSDIPDGADVKLTMAQYGIDSDEQLKIRLDTVYLKDPPQGFDPNNINWKNTPLDPVHKIVADVKKIINGDFSGEFNVTPEILRRLIRVYQADMRRRAL